MSPGSSDRPGVLALAATTDADDPAADLNRAEDLVPFEHGPVKDPAVKAHGAVRVRCPDDVWEAFDDHDGEQSY